VVVRLTVPVIGTSWIVCRSGRRVGGDGHILPEVLVAVGVNSHGQRAGGDVGEGGGRPLAEIADDDGGAGGIAIDREYAALLGRIIDRVLLRLVRVDLGLIGCIRRGDQRCLQIRASGVASAGRPACTIRPRPAQSSRWRSLIAIGRRWFLATGLRRLPLANGTFFTSGLPPPPGSGAAGSGARMGPLLRDLHLMISRFLRPV